MRKKIIRVLFLTLILLSLTGCGFVFKANEFEIFGLTFFEFLKTPDTYAMDFCLLIVQVINEWFASVSGMIYELATNSTETITKYLSNMTGFATVVKSMSILSAVAIMIFFAIGVFKDSLFEQNRDMAPDITTRIKKVLVAVVLTLIIPYICVSGFVASSYLGALASAKIMDGTSGANYAIYEEMNKQGLSYGTYCLIGQNKTADHSNITKLNGYGDSRNIEYLSPDDVDGVSLLSDEFLEKFPQYANVSAYDFWCGGGDGSKRDTSLNIYTSLFIKGRPFSNVAFFNAGAPDVMGILFSIVTIVAVLIVSAFATVAMAQRVVEIVFLVATSWWYIGHSVADLSNKSLGALSKKLITICVTQFFFVLELGVFITLCVLPAGNGGFGGEIVKIMFLLAMGFVIIGTPGAIEKLVQDTGMSTHAIAAVSKNI